MTPSKELVPLKEVRESLLTGRFVEPVDPDLVAEMIGQRLLQAESLDEIMDPEGSQTTDRMLGVPFTLRSAIFMPSDIEEAKIRVYAVLDIVDDDGVPHLFTCGGRGVCIQLLRLLEHDALPRRVKLIEVGRQRGTRNRPLYLQDVPNGTGKEAAKK